MLAKRISQLKPGDVFIWGDANTRSNMVVRGDILGPLVCVKVEPAGDTHPRIYFVTQTGEQQHDRFYEKTDIAILGQKGLCNLVNYEVTCKNCKNRYGDHMGVYCPDGAASTYFVPSQADLEIFHSQELAKAISGTDCDDFFDSIGL